MKDNITKSVLIAILLLILSAVLSVLLEIKKEKITAAGGKVEVI